MQIEKHIKIVPTPTGAVVFFAGQVCLSVNEHSGRYTWSISPVFARLTTGISNCFQVPMASWDGQETLAEAIADGLVKLDEMQAFYGVIDIPEDTYVGEHLDEGVDEDTEDLLAESFVVRNSNATKTKPSRVMVSADAVIKRAREMAKEAGDKSHGKFIKLAHSEIASTMKSESEEIEGDQIEEGSVSKEKQKTPYRNINSPEYKVAAEKQKQKIANDKMAEPGKRLLSKLNNEEFIQYEDDQIKEGFISNVVKGIKRKFHGKLPAKEVEHDYARSARSAIKNDTTAQADKAIKRFVRVSKVVSPNAFPPGYKAPKRGISNEEFIQYEDALPAAFQSIKEDCRNEALSMTDSLVEAQQLANELFEDIVEEYLNEASSDFGMSVSVDEAALSGDAYWKSKEAESKEEFLKAQRKALGLPEPVKRGRGKPTLIDRDLLKTRAHSNVEAGKRPTAGFDRNEKIHFVRHLKNHPDFADKHVSQAGRPTGTTKVAKQQKELAKKKQDSAFSMWAGLGKR